MGLDFDASVAWPMYGWQGVAKAALESVSRYIARDLGPAGIRSTWWRRARSTVAARDIEGFEVLAGTWLAQAPLGWDLEDPRRSRMRACSCCRIWRARSRARSSTSTAACTRSGRRRPRTAAPGPPLVALTAQFGQGLHFAKPLTQDESITMALPPKAVGANRQGHRAPATWVALVRASRTPVTQIRSAPASHGATARSRT